MPTDPNESLVVKHAEVVEVLDDRGWSFLLPRMPDGTLGQQIDSSDIADLIFTLGEDNGR